MVEVVGRLGETLTAELQVKSNFGGVRGRSEPIIRIKGAQLTVY